LMPSAAAQKGPALQRIDRGRLCVTNGVVSSSDGRLAIATSSSRAIVQSGTDNAADQVAEIRFQYLGPSQDSRPLASGQMRRQIGLKLRAEDSCNLIYAMWRIEPEAKVVVSTKRNSGQHAHRQCGVHGYINFKPQDDSGPLPVRPGESHTLRAELRGHDLTVTADGKVAWQGSLAGAMARQCAVCVRILRVGCGGAATGGAACSAGSGPVRGRRGRLIPTRCADNMAATACGHDACRNPQACARQHIFSQSRSLSSSPFEGQSRSSST
jgi:hypothetical protein